MSACLDTKSVQGFKSLFFRDFYYLPSWEVDKIYNSGDVVYYETNKLFYKCNSNGTVGGLPTGENWGLHCDDALDYIQDADITKAFQEATLSFNEGLVDGDCDQILFVYYYLTAHYLVNDIRTSSKGLNGTGEGTITSKSAGGVSVTYAIPEIYLNNPSFNFYTKSDYGIKYLNLVYPKLIGNVEVVKGRTQA